MGVNKNFRSPDKLDAPAQTLVCLPCAPKLIGGINRQSPLLLCP
jgi:hypothetical protein